MMVHTGTTFRPPPYADWYAQCQEAVVRTPGGFLRARDIQHKASQALQIANTPAFLRSWLYQDVHSRISDPTASYLPYERLPLDPGLLHETIDAPDWQQTSEGWVHPTTGVLLATTKELADDGFEAKGGVLQLPRVRCGTSPGWMTVRSRVDTAPSDASRFYLPSATLEWISTVVSILDSTPHLNRWTLKSSTVLARDGRLVSRADQTVLYLDTTELRDPWKLVILMGRLAAALPPKRGPGFSVPITEQVYYGGNGRRFGSHGTRLADIAASALLQDEPALLRDEMKRLEEELDANFEGIQDQL